MKILIVDDEQRHCRGMATMIQSTRSQAQVIVAMDGLKALEIAQSERPDVILTDIRMPKMDGLTLLSKLSKGNFKPKVIMLSAYDLFDYAQQAIRYGAFDYLLKPVDTGKLEDILKRIENELLREEAERKEAKWVKDRLSLTATAHRKQLVLQWLFGTLTSEEQRELKLMGINQGEGTVVFSDFRLNNLSLLPQNMNSLLSDLELVCSTIGGSKSLALHVPGPRQVINYNYTFEVVTIVHITSDTFKEQHSKLRAELEQFSDRWSGYCRITHTVGLHCVDLDKEISAAYRAAVEASRYLFHDRWKGVLFYDELNHLHKKPLLELDEERLKISLLETEESEAIHQCCTAFEKLANDGQTDPVIIKEYASLTLTKFKNDLADRLGAEKVIKLIEMSVESIPACESFSNLMEILKACLSEIHFYWSQMRNDKREFVIDSCIALIHERFMDNLSLDTFATRYHFNISYFSTLFKKRTGKTFSAYLIDVRMKRAEELLRDSDMRIYEIASNCGYRDTKYFARVFKKYFGRSPENFRYLSTTLNIKDEHL